MLNREAKYKLGDWVLATSMSSDKVSSGVVVNVEMIKSHFLDSYVYLYSVVFDYGTIGCVEREIVSYDRDKRIDKILGYE